MQDDSRDRYTTEALKVVYYIVYFVEHEYSGRLPLFTREMCRKLNFGGKKVFRIWRMVKGYVEKRVGFE